MSEQYLVLEYMFVSKMSQQANTVNGLKKFLWSNNRKLHSQLKDELKEVYNIKESLTYYVMSSNEVSVKRAKDTLNELEILTDRILRSFKEHLINRNRIELKDKINELEIVKEEIDGLRVAIELVEHPKSFFAQLK